VVVFVSAFNEERVIGKKIENLLNQDYGGNYEILVASDGSTDGTVDMARSFVDSSSKVRVCAFRENRGKSAMQNDIVPELDCDVVLFTDATSFWSADTLRRILENLAAPEVGCVGVDLAFVRLKNGAVERGQGAYWRYESLMRRCGALVKTNIVVSGTCYAMRRDLFTTVPADVGDDLANPLAVTYSGKRVVFDPTIAIEEVSNIAHESEVRMRRRVALQNVAALFRYWRRLHPKYGFAAYQLLAHKYLRALCWAPLVLAFVINLLIARQGLYVLTFGAQLTFYGMAFVGFWRHRQGKSAGFMYIPYYFCLLNSAYLVAFVQFFAGERKSTWKPER